MSVAVKDVQALNGRIEELNTKRTKVETQTEMLKGQLSSELSAYEKEFGVNLQGVTLAQTRKLITAEVTKVLNEVSAEYQLKERVVELIEQGDIEAANKLLGVETAPAVEEQVVEQPVVEVPVVEEPVVEETTAEDLGNFSLEEMPVVEEELELPVSDGIGAVESVAVEPKVKTTKQVPEGMTGFQEAMGTVEETFQMPSIDVDALEVEDDDDKDPFGFGDMLSGTSKFQ